MYTPFITVVINCYNGQRFLREAIDSVYKQTYSHWEIVFWDNASTDKSADIARSYDEKIRYFLADKNTPLYNARNKAIKQSKGQYIAILDADDVWEPDKLEKIVDLTSKKPGAAAYASNCRYLMNGKLSKRLYSGSHDYVIERSFSELIESYDIAISSVVIDKAVFDQHGGFDDQFELTGDKELLLRISLNNIIYIVPEVLVYIRVHEDNETNNNIGRFSKENYLLIVKALGADPDYYYDNVNMLFNMVFKMAFQRAVSLWGEGENMKCRSLIHAAYPPVKYFLFYVVTFLPSKIRTFLTMMYRYIR